VKIAERLEMTKRIDRETKAADEAIKLNTTLAAQARVGSDAVAAAYHDGVCLGWREIKARMEGLKGFVEAQQLDDIPEVTQQAAQPIALGTRRKGPSKDKRKAG
jgi:hypothetical protein